MEDEEKGLDDFLASDNEKETAKTNSSTQNQTADNNDLDLEDAFAKLLNDFITQDINETNSTKDKEVPQAETRVAEQTSLDSMINSETSLDDMIETPQEKEESSGLDGFIDDTPTSSEISPEDNTSSFGGLDNLITPQPEDEDTDNNNPNELKPEEQELARAITNFQDAITAIASKKNYKVPQTDYEEKMLLPNYKPSIGKKIAQYLLDSWNILNKYAPQDMKKLSPNATDEDYLSFAENLTDTYMQLAIISYVEILMNMEICENSYQQKKEEMQKRRIRRELYEEYMDLQERKQTFIEKIMEKNFPIDAKNLINNYFRVAQKDAEGSFEALTKNPATFSPIQVEKISPKFFGLIKVTPEDGIKANQKIGKFIKNLKV